MQRQSVSCGSLKWKLMALAQVREWAQYSMVCREWRAAFQSQPLCVVFDEVRARLPWSLPFGCSSLGRSSPCEADSDCCMA